MTTIPTPDAAPADPRAFRLPDIPEKHPDDMTSAKQLAEIPNMSRLKIHLGQPETTIVSGERYLCAAPGSRIRYPDLLVAFGVDAALYEANNGYIVSLQGKPPDLILEIASRRTGDVDTGEKPEFYAGLGVREYWRFDETGEFHGEKLAGDRLVNGQYEPITIHESPSGELRGYSDVLGLNFCWRAGNLDLFNPQTEDYIPSQESERRRAEAAEARADAEREARLQEQAESEARIRELEARLRAAQGEGDA